MKHGMNWKLILITVTNLFSTCALHADNGHGLWLRYAPKSHATVIAAHHSPTIDIAVDELERFYQGDRVVFVKDDLPKGGFQISNDTIRANDDTGFLYAAYALLRLQATHADANNLKMDERPAFRYRILDHWDNIDGSVERGYAGKSIFFPSFNPQRIKEYARANASIGINGSVINNVNASPKILTDSLLESVKSIADILRPYGIRVYLSINFGTPKALGVTDTADPLNPAVISWWQETAKRIYRLIPDFGGFLVKASSEGQPGPNDYGRTHADGANMLADAVKPYGGIVVWRSFVYGANHKGEDRVMQAVSEFKPLDGQFRDNVILQSKNGPLDFQPREPYAPIFDNMKRTPQIAEFQITQEYTGQSKHLVYLAPMWKEFFSFVAPNRLQGIAGVSNVGDTENWCGHLFSQANWYAFGRLAWNPALSSDSIAKEWVCQTFPESEIRDFRESIVGMMEESREICVDYMMPLGLHHIFAFDHHYGPDPGGYNKDYPIEWCPVYYHKADSIGVGFDRSTSGSNAVSQYSEPYRSTYNKVETCPEEYLLWFHHVGWNDRLHDGQTLWQNLCRHYNDGVKGVEMETMLWRFVRPAFEKYDDTERWQAVDQLLQIQLENAREWRDTCLRYFGQFSKQSYQTQPQHP